MIRLPFLIKALYAAGVVPDAAEVIDHKLPPAAGSSPPARSCKLG